MPQKPTPLSSRSIRMWTVVALSGALLFASIAFNWELPKLAYIALVRVVDMTDAALRPPILAQSYDEVVEANTAQTAEIERYLEEKSSPDARTPDALGLKFTSEADYLQSCKHLRSLLASNLGYPPPAVVTGQLPNLVRLSEDELATYYDFTVTVLQGVQARGIFMMPRSATGKTPLIIAVKGRAGMPIRPKSGKFATVERHNRDVALGALRKGYAVWEPLLVFYAENRPADIRERLEVRAREHGTSLPAIEIAKIRGGLDALLSSQPIDPTRIAMVGASYGGFYTLYTTALDNRVRVAVVAAYFNDRKAILDASEPFGNPDWRFPNSLSVFQDSTMAALVCPRPLQIQSGDHDQLFPIAGARRRVPAVRALYNRLNIGDKFSYVEFIGRHDFRGDEAWDFIDRFFRPSE